MGGAICKLAMHVVHVWAWKSCKSMVQRKVDPCMGDAGDVHGKEKIKKGHAARKRKGILGL